MEYPNNTALLINKKVTFKTKRLKIFNNTTCSFCKIDSSEYTMLFSIKIKILLFMQNCMKFYAEIVKRSFLKKSVIII